jgi:hypothetical protein
MSDAHFQVGVESRWWAPGLLDVRAVRVNLHKWRWRLAGSSDWYETSSLGMALCKAANVQGRRGIDVDWSRRVVSIVEPKP